MHVFIYPRNQKNRNVIIYKKPTLFKKQDNFRYVFIYKKLVTLSYAIFHGNFEVGTYIQKSWHFALRDAFIYKDQTLHKKQYNLRHVFIYKNPDTLRYSIFMEFLKLAEGGGHFYM